MHGRTDTSRGGLASSGVQAGLMEEAASQGRGSSRPGKGCVGEVRRGEEAAWAKAASRERGLLGAVTREGAF